MRPSSPAEEIAPASVPAARDEVQVAPESALSQMSPSSPAGQSGETGWPSPESGGATSGAHACWPETAQRDWPLDWPRYASDQTASCTSEPPFGKSTSANDGAAPVALVERNRPTSVATRIRS